MDHGFDAFLAQQSNKLLSVACVDLTKRGRRHGLLESPRKIVDDHYGMPTLFEKVSRVRADVAGAASHQNLSHVPPSLADALLQLCQVFERFLQHLVPAVPYAFD